MLMSWIINFLITSFINELGHYLPLVDAYRLPLTVAPLTQRCTMWGDDFGESYPVQLVRTRTYNVHQSDDC